MLRNIFTAAPLDAFGGVAVARGASQKAAARSISALASRTLTR
jgi:hypothetical protein